MQIIFAKTHQPPTGNPSQLPWQLTDIALKLIWVPHSFEHTSGEVLTHHATIQVIRIQVLKVTTLPLWIKPITHVLIVHLHISMNCLSDATSSTSLKHQQHIEVSYKFQVNTSLLKAGLTSQSGRGEEVGRTEGIMF